MPSASVPLPFNVTVFTGKVMTWSEPALAVGAWLAAAFTVTCKKSVPVAPLLSVTVIWNW